MGDFWNLHSVNSDLEGMEFISTLEAKDFPFYATQVHKLSTTFTTSIFTFQFTLTQMILTLIC